MTKSLPALRLLVAHVAVPGYPELTLVLPQPVFELQATVPPTRFGFALPFRWLGLLTSPVSLVIVAVNVTGDP